MSNSDNENSKRIVQAIVDTYEGDSGINFIDVTNLPVRDKILEILDLLIELMFPGYTGKRIVTRENVEYIVGDIICQVQSDFREQIELAFRHQCRLKKCGSCDCHEMAKSVTSYLLERIPAIRDLLKSDVQAAFDGDPAAKSFEEIIISYPYIIAIAIHRIAHELHLKDVPLIPRIMNESAHSRTGIDIHPGAKIGKSFFIDHGTGVVIGETVIIGENVKLYQGVTLGAMSFPIDERGRIIKGGKRHPTLEDGVVIYAESTILGDITIGKSSVIGANAWVDKSVPADYIITKPKSETRHIPKRKTKK